MGLPRAALSVIALIAFASDKPAIYPEHGTVIAKHVNIRSGSTPVYTDPYGKVQGGVPLRYKVPTYRVETADRYYELSARRSALDLGSEIDFRIEKNIAYVRSDKKEGKFEVTGVELKTSTAPR